MKILHVIASLAPRYGGPSVACPALCRELARRGHEVSIFTTNVDGNCNSPVPLDQPVLDAGVEILYFHGRPYPPEYKFSPSLWCALERKIPLVDAVHVYSLYIFSATAAAHLCRRFGVPYLLHPHGTLDPFLLQRHRLRKWFYTALFERKKFQHAAAILFNSAEEMRLASDWLDRKLPATPRRRLPSRVMIPVGVEEECLLPVSAAARGRFYERFPALRGRRILLFFGRLSFKKGMEILAQAFVRVAREQNHAQLVLAGPDTEGYGKKLREWLKAGGALEKATFTGPLAGEERFVALQQAEALVLPSYSENFGQSVAEAMACAVPVVISDRVNLWPEVKEAGAGLVVPCDAQQIAAALLTILANPGLGRRMGARGRRLVEEKFTWKVVGDQMLGLYEEIVHGAAPTVAVRKPLEEQTVV